MRVSKGRVKCYRIQENSLSKMLAQEQRLHFLCRGQTVNILGLTVHVVWFQLLNSFLAAIKHP
jgi:hypothetical protein